MSEPKETSPRGRDFELVLAKLQEPAARAIIVAVESMSDVVSASAEVARFAGDQLTPPFTTFFSS